MIIHIDASTGGASSSPEVVFSSAAGSSRGKWRGLIHPPVYTDLDVELEFPGTFEWGRTIRLTDIPGPTDRQLSEDPLRVVAPVVDIGFDGVITIDLQGSLALRDLYGLSYALIHRRLARTFTRRGTVQVFPTVVEVYLTNV